jgi:hypothetical protein
MSAIDVIDIDLDLLLPARWEQVAALEGSDLGLP